MPASRAKIAADIATLEAATHTFEKVVNLVKSDRLPGPVVPDLLTQVFRLSRNPNVSFAEVSRFCAKHQALSAKLLALVNSAQYARGKDRVTSLETAIARVGLKQTFAILHTVAMRGYVVGKDPELRRRMQYNLQFAYVVALAAQAEAMREKQPIADEVYTVGLLHNIGWTFYLYTLGLLQDAHEVGRINFDAISSVGRKYGPRLNEAIAKHMGLPADVVAALLMPQQAPERTRLIVNYVHRGMWAAENLLARRDPADLKPDAESDVLGIGAATLQLYATLADAWLELLQEMGADKIK